MRPVRRIVVCTLLSLPLAAQEAAPSPPAPLAPPPVYTVQECAAIDLLRGLRKKERAPDEELAARLAQSGDGLLSLYFEVLAER